MRGLFVPNFIEIRQLVKKVTFGGGPPPRGGTGGKFKKVRKPHLKTGSKNMLNKFGDDRMIFDEVI